MNTKKIIRFGIIDDNITMRRELEDLIRATPQYKLDYAAESLAEVIKKEYASQDYSTDILFLDMHWEHNGSEGLTIIDYLNTQPHFKAKIIVISNYSLALIGNDLRRRPNVCGCISKDLLIERNGEALFLDMISTITEKKTLFFTDADFFKVSPRELEITWRMSRGQALTEIEQAMEKTGIAESVRLLKKRFNAPNREMLVLKMEKKGFLSQQFIQQKFANDKGKLTELLSL